MSRNVEKKYKITFQEKIVTQFSNQPSCNSIIQKLNFFANTVTSNSFKSKKHNYLLKNFSKFLQILRTKILEIS